MSFTVVSRSSETFLPGFEGNPAVGFAPLPEGEITRTEVDDTDKWTHSAQNCIVVAAEGRSLKDNRMLSVLFHIDPSSVSSFWFANDPPYFDQEYPEAINFFRSMTRDRTRAIGIAGGYTGEAGGHISGSNRRHYGRMVKRVKQLSRKLGMPEPYILQPPKWLVGFTDVYLETQTGVVTITTRSDNSDHVWTGDF